MIENLPVRDYVAAVSVGVYRHVAVLDLDYAEDSTCETDMNVVMTGRGGFVEVQGTAEGEPFTEAQMACHDGACAQGHLGTDCSAEARPWRQHDAAHRPRVVQSRASCASSGRCSPSSTSPSSRRTSSASKRPRSRT